MPEKLINEPFYTCYIWDEGKDAESNNLLELEHWKRFVLLTKINQAKLNFAKLDLSAPKEKTE